MNLALWIAAALLCLVFLASGLKKLGQPREKLIEGGYRWADGFSRGAIKVIGVAEVLGALGLVLPAALGVASALSAVAAAGLALLMGSAVVMHLRRAETSNVAAALALALLTGALAVLRLGPYPF